MSLLGELPTVHFRFPLESSKQGISASAAFQGIKEPHSCAASPILLFLVRGSLEGVSRSLMPIVLVSEGCRKDGRVGRPQSRRMLVAGEKRTVGRLAAGSAVSSTGWVQPRFLSLTARGSRRNILETLTGTSSARRMMDRARRRTPRKGRITWALA